MKLRLFLLILGLSLLAAPAARADVAGLQLNPLKYEDTLTTTTVKTGFIDVANPSDAAVSIATRVQGFRQADLEGRLAFFDDADLSAGIQVSLDRFELGPREALRVMFNVDPTKLPRGGVYAAIFFQTLPPEQSSNHSYVSESAKIGTLLILNNGGPGQHLGEIKNLSLPFWQVGPGLRSGSITYRNTDRSHQAIGFNPVLTARIFPWGHPQNLTTGLVLPGSTRHFALERPGSYAGLIPVTVTDRDSGHSRTVWVLACTGVYRFILPIVLMALLAIVLALRGQKPKLRHLWSQFMKRFRRRPHAKRPMDGLSSKS